MKRKSALKIVAPPDSVISTFRLARWEFKLAMPKDKIPRESVNMLTAVTIRAEKPVNVLGGIFPIVVFPARLNSDLMLEQVAEGFPCKTESEAARISESIQAKNRKVPPVG